MNWNYAGRTEDDILFSEVIKRFAVPEADTGSLNQESNPLPLYNKTQPIMPESLGAINMFNDCIKILTSYRQAEDSFKDVLEIVCRFFSADKGCIDLFTGTNIHVSWAQEGDFLPFFMNSIPIKTLKLWNSLMRHNSYVFIKDLSDPIIPVSITERCRKNHIRSIYITPMYIEDILVGFISLCNINADRIQALIMNVVARTTARIIQSIELRDKNLELQFRDPLTGSLNLEGFKKGAVDIIRNNPQKKFSLWYCDIKRFKYINDMFGYELGDKFLMNWISLIQNNTKENETFCRVSADNILILRWFKDINEIYERFEKVCAALDGFTGFKGNHFKAEIACGIYLLEPQDMQAPDINKMIDRANIAQKYIKSISGNQIALYNDKMRKRELYELEICQHMHVGISDQEFQVWYQPQFNYATGKLIGAEALIRWKHPELGFISPGDFVPILESNGLITDLDMYVWEEACRFMRGLLDSKDILPAVSIAVNISRMDIYKMDLPAMLLGLVEKYSLTTSMLKLEITESAYMENPEQLIEVVVKLRKLGFTVEMDDFGSGYSSLNILKDVPVNILKLDMKFLVLVSKESINRGSNILSSIIRMAHKIGLLVIAEGVESYEQADYLKNLGCMYMQGYCFARPMPAEEFINLLKKGTPVEETANGSSNTILNISELTEEASDLKEYEKKLKDALYENSVLTDIMPGSMVRYSFGDEKFLFNAVSSNLLKMLGYSREAFIKKFDNCYLKMVSEYDRERISNELMELEEDDKTSYSKYRIESAGGDWKYVEEGRRIITDRHGKKWMYGLIMDLYDSRLYNRSEYWKSTFYYLMNEEKHSIIFDYNPIDTITLLYTGSAEGGIEEDITSDYRTSYVISKLHPDYQDKILSKIAECCQSPQKGSIDYLAAYFGEEYTWCRAYYSSMVNDKGKIYRVVCRIDDIEEDIKLLEKASRDSMTGLLNSEATKTTIMQLLDEGCEGALFVIDIDDFKLVNDTLGHLYGDRLLKEISTRLGRIVRGEDILGRIGGDEFVIFMAGSFSRELAVKKAKSILDEFEKIKLPEMGNICASIGIILTKDAPKSTYNDLFYKADISLYKAKRHGKNQIVLYKTADNT